ncbi:MAG: hypothetical protein GY801_22215 [bacterium]|nr:hypothetical protein [bacterium]
MIKDEDDQPADMVKIVYRMEELPQGMELAFSRQTSPEIVTAFREALEQLKQDGTYGDCSIALSFIVGIFRHCQPKK